MTPQEEKHARSSFGLSHLPVAKLSATAVETVRDQGFENQNPYHRHQFSKPLRDLPIGFMTQLSTSDIVEAN